jgi:hypothetical protein
MGTDDTIARLRALSERLDRIRRQTREVHDVAADEVRNAHTNRRQRGISTLAEQWRPAAEDSY